MSIFRSNKALLTLLILSLLSLAALSFKYAISNSKEAKTAPAKVKVQAGTSSGQELFAPEERQSFSMAIYGDRTGGPRSGLEILRKAVEMTNWLDPTFVMTVGDLINGYNREASWLQQALEYKLIMKELNCPWYPVAGNHDVYARPQKEGGHLDLYKEHFGPLYYSFDYKWAHFIVLFSDEKLSFSKPAINQNMGKEQIDWLKQDLAKSSGKQVFVFLHHPRWTYKGCNWDDVHNILKDDGRVEAVIAGHVHHYRDDGIRDGIHYFAMAVTGGHPGKFDKLSLHHINHMLIRPDRWSMSVIPVGAIYPANYALGSEVDELYRIGSKKHLRIKQRIKQQLTASSTFSLPIEIKNPLDRAISYQYKVLLPEGWQLSNSPETQDGSLAAKQEVKYNIKFKVPALADYPTGQSPRIAFDYDYTLSGGAIQKVSSKQRVRLDVRGLNKLSAKLPDQNSVLQLDGKSALRINLRAKVDHMKELTLECWARGEQDQGRCGLLTKTQRSSFGIFWSDQNENSKGPQAYLHRKSKGYLKAVNGADWKSTEWNHIAMCYDNEELRLYINGKLQGSTKGSGQSSKNRLDFLIGADPSTDSKPMSFFKGEIDEVRISQSVRYTKNFTPQKYFVRDKKTLLLHHFDQSLGGVFADDSGHGHTAWPIGNAKRVELKIP